MVHTTEAIKKIASDLIVFLGGDRFKERHNATYLWTIENEDRLVEVAYLLDNPFVNRVQVMYDDSGDCFMLNLTKCEHPYRPDDKGEKKAFDFAVYAFELEEVVNDLIEKTIKELSDAH